MLKCYTFNKYSHIGNMMKKPSSMTDDLRMQLQYDPNRLLDTLLNHMGLKNDAALARRLEVAPPVMSKIRHLTLTVGATILIRMHEESGLSIRELRHLMGDYRDNSFMPPGILKK